MKIIFSCGGFGAALINGVRKEKIYVITAERQAWKKVLKDPRLP